jgi:hypothetical protein
MNTRSSKKYRYIFITTWKQDSTSHLSSRLTDNASGKLLIIFILSYLFMLPTSFLRISKTHNRTSLQIWMQMYCTFVPFVNQHFPGLPASGTHCIKLDQWDSVFLFANPQMSQGSITVKALCYRPKRSGFPTGWVTLFLFSICLILPAALGPGIYSLSNGNEYQKQKNNISGE